MNRTLISAATLLFLASSAFAFQASESDPFAGLPASLPDQAAAESKFPSVFTHPIGFSIRHPADWREQVVNGITTLKPSDSPVVQGESGEFYAITAMAAPADIEEHLKSDIAASLPGLQLQSSSTTDGTVLIRYATMPQEGQPRIAATVRATTKNNLLIAMIGLGVESAISKHDAMAADIFKTTAAAPRSLDPAIRGTWTHSSSYSSSGFSMASVRKCTLAADGTYRHSSQTAGGTSDVSADTGESADTGIWAAKDGTLTIITGNGTTLTYKYRMIDGNLVTYDAGNKRTIWSR